MVVFAALRNMEHTKSTFRILNFGRAHFWLFKELNHIGPPWETLLRDMGAGKSWQIFKDVFNKAQEIPIPGCKKSGKEGIGLAWLS